jgi:hypothetical protein
MLVELIRRGISVKIFRIKIFLDSRLVMFVYRIPNGCFSLKEVE